MAASSSAALAYFMLGSSRASAAGRAPSTVRLPRRAGQGVSRWALRCALDRAHASFARRHPRWAAGLFDRHFLAWRVEPLINRALHSAAPISPAALARAWAEQFGPGAAQALRRHSADVIAVAEDFLALLEAEISV
jgi:hypothetical protein